MSTARNIMLTSALGFILALVAMLALSTPIVSSQELLLDTGQQNNLVVDEDDDAGSNEADEAPESDNTETYAYEAQRGDSYSLIARKAVQTFGLKHGVDLSEAQIIFAETNLTKGAGSPLLDIGQSVEISEATIEDVVERAGELSDDKLDAWAIYAAHADFNTDHVGESA